MLYVYGYKEKVNKIVVYCDNGKKLTRKLAINGINDIGSSYTYYNIQDGLLHFLDKKQITKIRLYHDNQFIMEI